MVQYLSNGVNNRGLLNYSLMYFLVSMVSTRHADARWKKRSRVSRVLMSTNIMGVCNHGNITPSLVSETRDDVISWKLPHYITGSCQGSATGEFLSQRASKICILDVFIIAVHQTFELQWFETSWRSCVELRWKAHRKIPWIPEGKRS